MKTFINIHEFTPIERIETEYGRLYKTPKGNYPSVTNVCGISSVKSIEAWRERVGVKKAGEIFNKVSSRGTAIHSLCEAHLKGEDVKVEETHAPMFNTLKPILNNRIDNIYAIEQMMYSDRLKIAGQCDLIAEFDGVLSVIDFKTSTKVKKREWIDHYFIQETFYAHMFWEHTKLLPKKLVIIMGIDNRNPAIFIETLNYKFINQAKDVRERFLHIKGI